MKAPAHLNISLSFLSPSLSCLLRSLVSFALFTPTLSFHFSMSLRSATELWHDEPIDVKEYYEKQADLVKAKHKQQHPGELGVEENLLLSG